MAVARAGDRLYFEVHFRMTNPDQRPAGEPPVEQPEGPDAFATGGEPRDEESVSEAPPSDQDVVERELADVRDKYLRLAAEFDNFRRRSQRERQETGTRAQAELLRAILDAIDDLDRFAHVDPATADAAVVIDGVGLVERKLLKTLGAAGLEIENPVDQPFDPARHEAVSTEPALSPEDDSLVSRVYQQGYLFGGQLLRPARVAVRQWNG
ncbi:MAG TPA: nucleotide exchange factor GrpE [Gemmatimonadaceae bacterium]|nr:nucleotide exchange factor GrpE [Gemmatimonadaceae bacterium]